MSSRKVRLVNAAERLARRCIPASPTVVRRCAVSQEARTANLSSHCPSIVYDQRIERRRALTRFKLHSFAVSPRVKLVLDPSLHLF